MDFDIITGVRSRICLRTHGWGTSSGAVALTGRHIIRGVKTLGCCVLYTGPPPSCCRVDRRCMSMSVVVGMAVILFVLVLDYTILKPSVGSLALLIGVEEVSGIDFDLMPEHSRSGCEFYIIPGVSSGCLFVRKVLVTF